LAIWKLNPIRTAADGNARHRPACNLFRRLGYVSELQESTHERLSVRRPGWGLTLHPRLRWWIPAPYLNTDRVVVSGNPARTASKIARHETLFDGAIVTLLIASVLFVVVTLALYQLLERVTGNLAILMVILGSLPSTAFVLRSTRDRWQARMLFAPNVDFLGFGQGPERRLRRVVLKCTTSSTRQRNRSGAYG